MIIILDCIQTTYEGHINATDATATWKKMALLALEMLNYIKLQYNNLNGPFSP